MDQPTNIIYQNEYKLSTKVFEVLNKHLYSNSFTYPKHEKSKEKWRKEN